MTRHALRSRQMNLLHELGNDTDCLGATKDGLELSSGLDMDATLTQNSTSGVYRPIVGATRIAPIYGSLEALLNSFVMLEDDTVSPIDADRRAQRDAYVLNRASRIAEVPVQMPKIIYPVAPGPDTCAWSFLLSQIKQRRKAFAAIRNKQSHSRSLICRAVERLFDERRSREERERQEEQRRQRQLARQVASMVRKKWKTIEQVRK
jgi:hypothetical protein